MSATQKFFRFVFGQDGDRAVVPDTTQPDGTLSYQEGFGFDYQRPKTDGAAKNIPRDSSNQIYYDLSLAIRQYQLNGVPEFVPAADNGGAPVSYGKYARVLFTDGKVYESMVAANVADPTDVTKWRQVSGGMLGTKAGVRQVAANTVLTAADFGSVIFADATAGPITITAPAMPVGQPGNTIEIWKTDTSANAVTVARAGADTFVGVGNWGSATSMVLRRSGDTANIMSSPVPNQWATVGSFASSFVSGNGFKKYSDGLIVQWGSAASSASADVVVGFPIAFPGAVFSVVTSQSGFLTGGTSNTTVSTGSITSTNFLLGAYVGSTGARAASTVSWIAIGN
jgi:hypothetical protein